MAKALTLWQPWASLIAAGIKMVETRSWPTHYRGRLLIHAAKFLPPRSTISELMLRAPEFFRAIKELERRHAQAGAEPQDSFHDFIATLPRGAVVAECMLIECRPAGRVKKFLTPREIACGYYDEGRFAWLLDMVVPVEPPVPVKGGQRLWIPAEEVLARCSPIAEKGA